MFCHQCGTKLPETAKFCPSCGTAVPAARTILPTDADEKHWVDAVTYEGLNLKDVPEPFRTRAVCYAVITRKGDYQYTNQRIALYMEFSLIPQDILTLEWCFAAVKKYGMLLELVPETFKTYELCLTAVSSDEGDGKTPLEFVPEQFKTYNLCMAALSNHGENLRFVPESLKDDRLCRIAFYGCKNSCNIFPFIPDQFKNESMCRVLVRQAGTNLLYIPEAFKTGEICNLALESGPSDSDMECLLKHVPRKFRTYDACLSTIRRNTEVWKYIPPELVDLKFCLRAMKQNTAHYDFIPEKYRNNLKIRDMYYKSGKS